VLLHENQQRIHQKSWKIVVLAESKTIVMKCATAVVVKMSMGVFVNDVALLPTKQCATVVKTNFAKITVIPPNSHAVG
jgi:hypothetical protein